MFQSVSNSMMTAAPVVRTAPRRVIFQRSNGRPCCRWRTQDRTDTASGLEHASPGQNRHRIWTSESEWIVDHLPRQRRVIGSNGQNNGLAIEAFVPKTSPDSADN
jgi:hypothetical protein